MQQKTYTKDMFLEARKKLALTQVELAQLLGVTPNYLSAVERGARKASASLIKILENELAKSGNTHTVINAPTQLHSPHAQMTISDTNIQTLLDTLTSQQRTIESLVKHHATLTHSK